MFTLTEDHIDSLIQSGKFEGQDLKKLLEMKEKFKKGGESLYNDKEMSNVLNSLIDFFQNGENSIEGGYKISEEDISGTGRIYNLSDKKDLHSFKKLQLGSKFKNEFTNKIVKNEFQIQMERNREKRNQELLSKELFD